MNTKNLSKTTRNLVIIIVQGLGIRFMVHILRIGKFVVIFSKCSVAFTTFWYIIMITTNTMEQSWIG